MNDQPLLDWIHERHAIYLRKAYVEGTEVPNWARPGTTDPEGWLGPDPFRWHLGVYTDDPILAEYRFCNVFRELDRVTVWIRENIREPFAEHEDLWLMLAIARYINWPETLRELMDEGAWPSEPGWEPADMTPILEARKSRGEKVETGAYMIRAESDPEKEWYDWSKQRYVSEVVIGQLWDDRELWRRYLAYARRTPRIQPVWESLARRSSYTGWGPFMAYQVVLDWSHSTVLPYPTDRETWAAVGPGSKRGLNRLHGRPVGASLSQADAVEEMRELLDRTRYSLASWVPPLEMEDIQNSLCETDKYLRVANGEGRPRSKYVPGRGY